MEYVTILILAGCVHAANASEIGSSLGCSKDWKKVNFSEQPLSDKEKLNRWKSITEKTCLESPDYFYRLGLLYSALKQYANGENAYLTALQSASPLEKQVRLSLANIYVQRGVKGNSENDIKKAEAEYGKLMELFPNFHGGYAQMGGLKLMLGDNSGVVKYSEASVEIQPSFYAYRNLVIAYQGVGKYEESINAFSRAYELDSGDALMSDRDSMLSVSVAYAEIGKYTLSKNALATLLQKRPDLEKDPNFISAISYIKALMSRSLNQE